MQIELRSVFLNWLVDAGPEPSPKLSTSPPASLGSPGRRPPKSPSEHKERKPSSSDDKKKVVSVFSLPPSRLHLLSDLDRVVSPAPRGLPRFQLLLGGPPEGGDHPEEDRYRFLRDRLQGQVARRRGGQDPQGDRADARAAAGLQKRNASATVSRAGGAARSRKLISFLLFQAYIRIIYVEVLFKFGRLYFLLPFTRILISKLLICF